MVVSRPKKPEGSYIAFTFIKTGAASAQLAQKAAAEQEMRRTEQGKLYRFWLKEKEEARITFVDGDLGPDGVPVPPRYYEHNLYLEGTWNNFFVCPEKTNPDANDKCPICESGDRPSLVALFTIIDHRQTQSKDKLKTFKDQKRLLVAKANTFEVLSRAAAKRGGLTGCTFDAARLGDKSASVGSQFDFVSKSTVEELQALYQVERTDPKTNLKTKTTYFTPADYEKEVTYRTGEQLRDVLKQKKAPTPSDVPFDKAVSKGAVDYSGQL